MPEETVKPVKIKFTLKPTPTPTPVPVKQSVNIKLKAPPPPPPPKKHVHVKLKQDPPEQAVVVKQPVQIKLKSEHTSTPVEVDLISSLSTLSEMPEDPENVITLFQRTIMGDLYWTEVQRIGRNTVRIFNDEITHIIGVITYTDPFESSIIWKEDRSIELMPL